MLQRLDRNESFRAFLNLFYINQLIILTIEKLFSFIRNKMACKLFSCGLLMHLMVILALVVEMKCGK